MPPERTVVTVEAMFQRVLAELTAIRSLLEQSTGRRVARDPAKDAALITALVNATETGPFNAADVLRLAKADPGLRAALEGCGVNSARRVGATLKRLHGRPIAGWRVTRVTRDGFGTIWAIDVSALRHTDASLSTSPAGQ